MSEKQLPYLGNGTMHGMHSSDVAAGCLELFGGLKQSDLYAATCLPWHLLTLVIMTKYYIYSKYSH